MSDEFLWLPINLDVDDTSLILPLVDFAYAGEFERIPAAPAGNLLGQSSEDGGDDQLDASFSIGLFGIIGNEAKGHWRSQSRNYLRFDDVPVPAVYGIGYTLRWGYGFRLHLRSEQFDDKLNIDLPQKISFASQLGLGRVSYGVEMLGLSDPSVLGWLPAPGSYDAQTWFNLDQNMRANVSRLITASELAAAGSADAQVQTDAKKVSPVPTALKLEGDYARRAFDKAVSVAFAARCISKGVSLMNALDIAGPRARLISEEVTRVYVLWQVDAYPEIAKSIGEMWFDDGPQAEISKTIRDVRFFGSTAAPADGTGTFHHGVGFDRVVMRSQLITLKTSQKLGYEPIGSLSAEEDYDRLVYELFLRHAIQSTEIGDGVSLTKGHYAGIRLKTVLRRVDAKLQANFQSIAAAVALNLNNASASFDRTSWGLSGLAEANMLASGTFDPKDFNLLYKSIEAAKQQIAKDPSLLRPEPTAFVAGADHLEAGFPGARAIYFALDQFKRSKYLETCQTLFAKLGLEVCHANAVYASMWSDVQYHRDPPDLNRMGAATILSVTEF